MKLEGRKCVVCSAYLFEDDDVVICPECGAPHHRDCWNAVGKCKLGDLHGTENQYKYEPEEENAETQPENKATALFCRGCGAEIEPDSNFCPYCNLPVSENSPNIQFAAPVSYRFDPNEELEDGVTVGEATKVVLVNGFRYIPKFKEFKKGKKVSWNWSAFLFPHGWYAFRKMYLMSALMTALVVAAALLMGLMPETPQEANFVVVILASVGSIINLVTRVIAAIFADMHYKNKVIETCKEIREAEDKESAIKSKGGINLLAFGIAIIAALLLEIIITAFI